MKVHLRSNFYVLKKIKINQFQKFPVVSPPQRGGITAAGVVFRRDANFQIGTIIFERVVSP